MSQIRVSLFTPEIVDAFSAGPTQDARAVRFPKEVIDAFEAMAKPDAPPFIEVKIGPPLHLWIDDGALWGRVGDGPARKL